MGSWKEGKCFSQARNSGFWVLGNSDTVLPRACAKCQVASTAAGPWAAGVGGGRGSRVEKLDGVGWGGGILWRDRTAGIPDTAS